MRYLKEMNKVRFRPMLIFKVFTSAILLIVLVFIVVNLIMSSKKKPKVPFVSEEIARQKIEQKEKVEHFEAEGKEGNYQIKADRHYIGEDNFYHVEGKVEIVFFKRIEGKDIFIYGDEIIYDKEGVHFFLRENAKIKFEDFILEASFLEYDSKEEVFKSDKGISFSSQRLNGSAQNLIYSLQQKKLELWDNIQLQMVTKLDPSVPLIVRADKLDFLRKTKFGTASGSLRLFHGKDEATADYLEFELDENEEDIRFLALKGSVKAWLIEEENKKERMIEAKEIRLSPFLNLPRVQAIEAVGNSSVKIVTSLRSFTQVRAETIKLVLGPDGKLEGLRAFKKARMVEQGESSEERRVIEGHVLTMDGTKQILRVTEGGGFRAKIKTKNSEIMGGDIIISSEKNEVEAKGGIEVVIGPAEEEQPSVAFFSAQDPISVKAQGMRYFEEQERFVFYEDVRISQKQETLFAKETVSFDRNKLEAKGGVEAVLKPPEGKEESAGFFEKEQPVFITAMEMRYFEEQERFVFNQNVKIWQQKKILLSDEVILYTATGEFLCPSGVKSIVPFKPEDTEEEERVEISAKTMHFRPEKNLISYEGGCSLKTEKITLNAQSVIIDLSREKGEMEIIIARDKVIIVQNQYEGRGEEARYDVAQKTIVLVGDPILIDKDKGQTEGNKLTFHIADGKIIVENKDRERSVTVIKS